MNPSSNLFLIGPMGAGKTSIGRCLARHFELPFVDLDQKIETDTGASIGLIFEHEGEAGFRIRESALLRSFSAKKGIVLACGGGVILEPENRELLCRYGFVVYLQANVEQQLQRLRRDRTRPLLASVDAAARLRKLASARNPLYAQTADLALQTGTEPVARASVHIARLIDSHWHRHGPAVTA